MTRDFILGFIGAMIVAFIAYSLLKKYVLSKFKVNKWVVVGLFVVAFVGPQVLLQANMLKDSPLSTTIQSGLILFLVLWLFDAMGWGRKAEPAKINLKTNKTKYATTTVIKPKAKPNRLKNTDMEVIDIKDIKKKKKK